MPDVSWSPEDESRLQYLNSILGSPTPQNLPTPTRAPSTPSIFGRIGQQLGNLPSNVLQGFASSGTGLLNLSQPESDQFTPPQVPKPFNIAPPTTAGQRAVDIGAGLSSGIAQALIPASILGRLGQAAGLTRGAATILGDVGAGGFLGLQQSPQEAATSAGQFGAMGAVNQLPLPWQAKAALNAAIAGGAQMIRGQPLTSEDSLVQMGVPIAATALHAYLGRTPVPQTDTATQAPPQETPTAAQPLALPWSHGEARSYSPSGEPIVPMPPGWFRPIPPETFEGGFYPPEMESPGPLIQPQTAGEESPIFQPEESAFNPQEEAAAQTRAAQDERADLESRLSSRMPVIDPETGQVAFPPPRPLPSEPILRPWDDPEQVSQMLETAKANRARGVSPQAIQSLQDRLNELRSPTQEAPAEVPSLKPEPPPREILRPNGISPEEIQQTAQSLGIKYDGRIEVPGIERHQFTDQTGPSEKATFIVKGEPTEDNIKAKLTEFRSKWNPKEITQPKVEVPSDTSFSNSVKAAAEKVPQEGWFGPHKVLINHLWETWRKEPGNDLSLPEFKNRAMQEIQKGNLSFSRADFPAAHSAKDLAEAHMQYGPEQYHFLNVKSRMEATNRAALESVQELKEQKSVKPEEILNKEKNIGVEAKGATFLKTVDNKGRVAIEPIANVQKGDNPFHQAGPYTSVEAGTKGRKGEFLPSEEPLRIFKREGKGGKTAGFADVRNPAFQYLAGASLGAAVNPIVDQDKDKTLAEKMLEGAGKGVLGVAATRLGVLGPGLLREALGTERMGIFAGKTAKGFEAAKQEGRIFRNPWDKQQRFEIPDTSAKLDLKDEPAKLYEVLDHPKLYQNYPSLKTVDVVPNDRIPQGNYDPIKDEIEYNPNMDPTLKRAVIFEEIQHAVQKREGFATGSQYNNPKYSLSAGEAEARDVGARSLFDPFQREETLPYSTSPIRGEPDISYDITKPMQAQGRRLFSETGRDEAAAEDVRATRTPEGRVANFVRTQLGLNITPEIRTALEKGEGTKGYLLDEANDSIQDFKALKRPPTPEENAIADSFVKSKGIDADIAKLDASNAAPQFKDMLKVLKQVQIEGQNILAKSESTPRQKLIESTVGDYLTRQYKIFQDPKAWTKEFSSGQKSAALDKVTEELSQQREFKGVDKDVIRNSVKEYLNDAISKEGAPASAGGKKIDRTLYLQKKDLTSAQWKLMEDLRSDSRLDMADRDKIKGMVSEGALSGSDREALKQIAGSGSLDKESSQSLREIAGTETVSKAWRDLFGEYTNPVEKQAFTVQKILQSVGIAKTISELDGMKLSDGRRIAYTARELSSELKQARDSGDQKKVDLLNNRYHELDNNPAYGKLAGKWVERGAMDALKVFESGTDGSINPWYAKIQNFLKMNSTVLNPSTHAHWWMQMPLMMSIARVYNPAVWKRSADIVFGRSEPEMLAELKKGGIVGADMSAREFKTGNQELTKIGQPQTPFEKLKNGGDKFLKFAGDLYGKPDNIIRTAAYLTAKDRFLEEANGAAEAKGLIGAEKDSFINQYASDKAIQFTNRYTWNYGAVPPLTKTLRNIPGLNPFLSYTSELLRVTKNLAEDLATGSSQDKMHAALNLGLMAAVPFALSLGSKEVALNQDDQDLWNRIQKLEPEYLKHSIKLALGRNARGAFNYIDFSPMLPASDLYLLTKEAATGDWKTFFSEQPLIGLSSSPLANLAMQVSQGQNSITGQKLYTPGDYAKLIWSTAAPPVLGTQLQRDIRSFSPNNQGDLGLSNVKTGRIDTPETSLLQHVGLRVASESFPQILQSANQERQDKIDSARQTMNQILKTNATAEAKADAIRIFRDRTQDVNQDFLRKVQP